MEVKKFYEMHKTLLIIANHMDYQFFWAFCTPPILNFDRCHPGLRVGLF